MEVARRSQGGHMEVAMRLQGVARGCEGSQRVEKGLRKGGGGG